MEGSMSEYQLDIKQVVDYPRCWIYRQFIQNLMADRSIRTGGGSTLFYYTVLCNYANFRTSYLRIDGIGYTVYPGEWICTVKELSAWFRTRFQCQAVSILDELQKRHLISYLFLDRGKVVKYKIPDWKKHNTVSDYNCPCQKDTGFFFMPTVVATELVSAGRCSEMDILLDLCMSAVYNDCQVQGSEIGPVVYLHNGTGSPLVACSEMAVRWGISKATTGRVLKKFIADNPLYHDTWKLLKKYRDVVWSLELSVQQVRSRFEIEYGSSIEDFLESVYVAGIDLSDRSIEHHAKCIERSHRMLKLLDTSIDLLRTKHKNGENYYWLLYYSFLSPQQLRNVEDIIEKLRPHIRDISFHTYYRRRREAIDALSSILWGVYVQRQY